MTTSITSPFDGILLFAHGSRDPLWRKPIEAVALQITSQQPRLSVACAYLELCEPSLAQAAEQMILRLQNRPIVTINKIALHADSMPGSSQKRIKIRILPMFLGMGKHAREDLPELAAELRNAHPDVDFEIAAAVGEDPRVTALLAQLALN
ncbi:MAG: sirohydrochlorin chelatase [Brachymonas sp.]